MEQFRLTENPNAGAYAAAGDSRGDCSRRRRSWLIVRSCCSYSRTAFPNTLETTTKLMDDGRRSSSQEIFRLSWLRDSVEQVMHYVPFAKEDADLAAHHQWVNQASYCNIFRSILMRMHLTKQRMIGIGTRRIRRKCRHGYGSASSSWIQSASRCVLPMLTGRKRS